ncbi:CBS domain-containing protein [Peptococcaceae bacterium 1198_IL3148]
MPTASDVMVSPVIAVTNNSTVSDVMEKFVANRISGLPVVNDANEPIGFISDGDIMKYIGYNNTVIVDYFTHLITWFDNETMEKKVHDLLKLNIMELANKRVITVDADTELDNVAQILGNKRIKKVPVVKNKKLVGIISRGDIIRYIWNKVTT